jgi:hypothetical protein
MDGDDRSGKYCDGSYGVDGDDGGRQYGHRTYGVDGDDWFDWI